METPVVYSLVPANQDSPILHQGLTLLDQDVQDVNATKPATDHRSRIQCGLIVILLIPLGLATRTFDWLPEFIRDHVGDALWAALIYWGIALVFPKLSIRTLVIGSLAFSFAIELSQLSSHPALLEARANRFGALVLGQGFLWVDLIRYTLGVATAACLDLLLAKHRTSRPPVVDLSDR